MRDFPRIVLLVVALALTYGAVAGYGFRENDFVSVRPWTMAEARSVWTGSWDPLGGNDAYYRPLSGASEALRAWAFGARPAALHLLSIVELGVVAWCLGLFVWRETASQGAALFVTLLMAVHPALPDAAVSHLEVQNHLLCLGVMVLALLTWQQVRDRPAIEWWPIGGLALVGLLLKEDLIVIGPAVLILQVVRRWCDPRATALSPALVIASALCCTALLAVRALMFPLPTTMFFDPEISHWQQFRYAPIHTLVLVGGRDSVVGTSLSLMTTLIAAAGLLALFRLGRSDRRDGFLLLSGAALMFSANLPLVVASGPTRQHLVALGASIVVTGAGWLVWRRATRTLMCSVAAALVIVLSIVVSRERSAEYSLCSESSVTWYDWVRNLPVPEALKQAYSASAQACRDGRDPRLPHGAIERAWRESRPNR